MGGSRAYSGGGGGGFSSTNAALAQRDIEMRRALQARLELRKSLSERGAVFERKIKTADARALRPLAEEPPLQHTEAYLEYRATRKVDKNRSAYLTTTPSEQAAAKQKAREEREQTERPPSVPAQIHARTKALVAETQKESIDYAEAMAARLNAKAVFGPRINHIRAYSTTRMEMRRHTSLDQLRRLAVEQVASGFVPKSAAEEQVAAAAAAAASGGAASLNVSKSDLLRGRLELLDEQFRGVSRSAGKNRRGSFGVHASSSSLMSSSGRRGAVWAAAPSGAPADAAAPEGRSRRSTRETSSRGSSRGSVMFVAPPGTAPGASMARVGSSGSLRPAGAATVAALKAGHQTMGAGVFAPATAPGAAMRLSQSTPALPLAAK
jgi:hypothetical protein